MGIVNYANDQKNKKKCATLLAYKDVCTVTNKTIADSFQIQASMRPKVKSPVKHVSFSQGETCMASSSLDHDLSFNNLCTTLGSLTEELLLQPHQAVIPSTGGGTSNSLGWRDDKNKDNQKNEPFCRPFKRRR